MVEMKWKEEDKRGESGEGGREEGWGKGFCKIIGVSWGSGGLSLVCRG